ncbi:MAG: YfhO family protein [Bacteroides sp.]|nr:YfhO family protein [Bacteroides sp.]
MLDTPSASANGQTNRHNEAQVQAKNGEPTQHDEAQAQTNGGQPFDKSTSPSASAQAAPTISLTEYRPDYVKYQTKNDHDAVAVFSEIYYPEGWHVTIDGTPAPLARANYILRALRIPAGEHTVEMHFDPKSLHVTEAIAYSAIALLFILLLTLTATEVRRMKH